MLVLGAASAARADTAATVAPPPVVPAALASSTTYAFPWRATTFRVVETIPEQHRSTVVIIVPGAFANDANGDYPALHMRTHFYEDLADVIAADGFAVIRYARQRDDWESETSLAQQVADVDLADRIAKIDRLVAFARRRPGVTGVAIVAHSEGCLAVAGSRAAVLAMLGVSCPGRRLFDTFLDATAHTPQGTSSAAYGQLARDVAAVRAGASETGTNDVLGAYFFGAMSSGPIAYLREMDRIEPCAAYAGIAFPIELLSGERDGASSPASCGSGSGARAALRRPVAGADHFMRVEATSPIPWIKGDAALSPAFERSLRSWLEALQ